MAALKLLEQCDGGGEVSLLAGGAPGLEPRLVAVEQRWSGCKHGGLQFTNGRQLMRQCLVVTKLLKPKALPKYPIFNVYPKREKNKHLAPGIYERLTSGFGKTLRPLFIYVDKPPTYKVRLQFDRIVRDTIALRLRANFERGYALADATKRT